MKRIGIYSGTFDPVHNGHIEFVRTAIERCGLDKVFFLVEPRPRRKHGVKALEHRIRMVQLAIKDDPRLSTIVLEQARFSVNHTLPILQSRFSGQQIYFLMGEDFFSHLSHWPHIDQLLQSVSFIIGVRSDKPNDELRAHIAQVEKSRGQQMKYEFIKTKQSSVSSNAIRNKIKKGEPAPDLHPAVADYIAEQNLYASETSSS